MKICIATGIYPPDIGGPATYSKLLNEELPKRGIEVVVLSFGEVRKLPKIIRHTAYFFKLLGTAKGCNIIYAQDPVSVGLPALIASKLLGKKFMLKVVGDYAWEQGVQRSGVIDMLDDFAEKKSGYPRLVQVLKFIQSKVAKSAYKVIVPSEYLKKIVMKWGVPAEKISVVYNAFEAPAVFEEKENVRKDLGLQGKVLLSIGRLVPWKGFLTLIETMSTLRKTYPDLVLLIAGSGPQEKELRDSIAKLELQPEVRLLGQVPHSTLLRYVKAADLFVLNTAYEGFSHQLLEVMALGTPIITTAVGGNVELIENGHEGILVGYNDRTELENAIRKLIADPSCGKNYVQHGYEKIGLFNVERMIDGLIAELNK